MWQRTVPIIAWGLLWAIAARSTGQETRPQGLLITDRNWVRFEVLSGRIAATSSRLKQDRQRLRRELPSGRVETLTVSIDRGLVSVHYLAEDPADSPAGERILIRVVRRDEVELEWSDATDRRGTTVTYRQPSAGDVELHVQLPDAAPRQLHGPSLWHLMLTDPSTCDKYLAPLLRILRADWSVSEEASAVRSLLLSGRGGGVVAERDDVQRLVQQLAHPEFRVRQQADRELRSGGPAVFGHLRQLDATSLDREQQLRVQAIVQSLTACRDDTPARVAARLRNDRAAWLALLRDEDPHHRTRAFAELSRLCGQPVRFDPLAPPGERTAQVARLHEELLRR